MQRNQNFTLPSPSTERILEWKGGTGHIHVSGTVGEFRLEARSSPSDNWGLLETSPASSLTPADMDNGSGGFQFRAMRCTMDGFQLRVIDASQTGALSVVVGYVDHPA